MRDRDHQVSSLLAGGTTGGLRLGEFSPTSVVSDVGGIPIGYRRAGHYAAQSPAKKRS
jgi:hypothetical protein